MGSHPRLDRTRIFLLGHSEGAIIIPKIIKDTQKSGLDVQNIRGSIFLSGLGENIFSAMSYQREILEKNLKSEVGLKGAVLQMIITPERIKKKVAAVEKIIKNNPEKDFKPILCGLNNLPLKWFREHRAYNFKEELAENVKCHCLAITGKKDVQVNWRHCETVEKVQLLLPNAASVTVHTPQNLTHLLRSIEGEPSILSVKGDYKKMAKQPLDAEMLEYIYLWFRLYL